jgi:putative ABC transport system permease protein
MSFSLAESSELLGAAVDALSRYKLRTTLNVVGVVLGVAAVIAMMSVSEGARLEAMRQVEALGLTNFVVRNHGSTLFGPTPHGLTADDARRLQTLVPLAGQSSPLIERYLPVARAAKIESVRVLGTTAAYRRILHLQIQRGRFVSITDVNKSSAICVLGASLAQHLFAFTDPLGQHVRIGSNYYEVVGVLRQVGADSEGVNAFAWRDLNLVAFTPLPTLSGRSLDIGSDQAADEIWLQMNNSDHLEELGQVFTHALETLHGGRSGFDVVLPHELLAQRFRTQRTFGVVIGSVAVLALLVGGIGIMNVMLMSVIERTAEIGVRRSVGATRRDVLVQFLLEALFMTLSGGIAGMVIGVLISVGITAYAGWHTQVSTGAIGLALIVSTLVGLVFGLYPAVQAARLDPVNALRYE